MDITHCPCRKKQCERHGRCDACREFHKDLKRPPACERSSLTSRIKKRIQN